MTQDNLTNASYIKKLTARAAGIHLLLFVVFAVSIILYDAFNLITPDKVMERWISAGMLLVVSMVVWLITRADIASAGIYKNLIFSLIITDILIAGISVYDQRGMASRAVALFFIPIVLSAVFRSAKALFATAALAAAVYAYAAIRYFFDNPSEGYKIELYGEVGFYSATFFIAAALLRLLIAESKKNIKPKT